MVLAKWHIKERRIIIILVILKEFKETNLEIKILSRLVKIL